MIRTGAPSAGVPCGWVCYAITRGRLDAEGQQRLGRRRTHGPTRVSQPGVYCYGQASEKELKALLIFLDSLPPYSHSLDRLVARLESAGLDVQPLNELRLKALSRMNSGTSYPSDREAPAGRFDEQDSNEARSIVEVTLAFTKNSIRL